MGTGLAADHRQAYSGMPAPAPCSGGIPYLSEIPLIGHAVFTQNILVYLDLHHPAGYSAFIMFRTRHG